jgi:hypothetical protein
MFGSEWGAFDTKGVHFFNPENPIYRAITRIAKIRSEQGTLRYGREYFRPIAGDAEHFGAPVDGHCTLAFSRVFDQDEMLICLNLDMEKRNDAIAMDANLTPPGTLMQDLLRKEAVFTVEKAKDGTAFVRVPLESHEMVVLKRIG